MVYGDTDSIVYIYCPGFPDPPLCDYPGDFKDELSNGDYIVEFASGVPKTTAKIKKSVKCVICSSTEKGPVK